MKLYIVTEKKLKKILEARLEIQKKELEKEFAEKQEAKDTEFLSLQKQINPHFLYNALECLRGHALLTNNMDIADMADGLSSYFRYCINSKQSIVTIGEELDNITNYLFIQRMRFGDKFTYNIDIEEPMDILLENSIPHMTLQPLLENAISHGLRNKTKDGKLEIRVKHTGQYVTIHVEDNGDGMTVEELANLNNSLSTTTTIKADKSGRHNGIALSNINKRIKLYFGDEYGLNINSIKNYGTVAEVLLPLKALA